MREAKIDYSLALPIATRPANSRGINTWAAAERSENIGLTGSIHPGDPHLPDTLKYIAEQGLPGIKLHPEYQQFDFADERLYPVWERCVELDLFVITHAGCDVMFKPPWHSDPARLAAFQRRFPELKLILAHLGSMEMWDAVETELAGLPVYFDLALLTPGPASAATAAGDHPQARRGAHSFRKRQPVESAESTCGLHPLPATERSGA